MAFRSSIDPKLLLLVGIAAVSLSSIISRASEANPLAIAFYRNFLGGLILLPFAYGRRSEFESLSRKEWTLLVVSGLFLSLHFATWITSLINTTITASLVLTHTDPLRVALLAYAFLGERPSRRAMTGFPLALIGVLLITAQTSLESLLSLGRGDLLALAGAATVSVYLLIGRSLRQKLSVTVYASTVYLFASSFLLVGVQIADAPLLSYSWTQYAMFLALAIGPSAIGHTSFNYALKHLKASAVSISTLGEPVVASLLAVFIFGEIPGPLTLLGAALVLAGLYYALK